MAGHLGARMSGYSFIAIGLWMNRPNCLDLKLAMSSSLGNPFSIYAATRFYWKKMKRKPAVLRIVSELVRQDVITFFANHFEKPLA